MSAECLRTNHKRVALAASSGPQQSTKSTTPGRSGSDIYFAPPDVPGDPWSQGVVPSASGSCRGFLFRAFGSTHPKLTDVHRVLPTRALALFTTKGNNNKRRVFFPEFGPPKFRQRLARTLESHRDVQWMEAVKKLARRKQHRKK